MFLCQNVILHSRFHHIVVTTVKSFTLGKGTIYISFIMFMLHANQYLRCCVLWQYSIEDEDKTPSS